MQRAARPSTAGRRRSPRARARAGTAPAPGLLAHEARFEQRGEAGVAGEPGRRRRGRSARPPPRRPRPRAGTSSSSSAKPISTASRTVSGIGTSPPPRARRPAGPAAARRSRAGPRRAPRRRTGCPPCGRGWRGRAPARARRRASPRAAPGLLEGERASAISSSRPPRRRSLRSRRTPCVARQAVGAVGARRRAAACSASGAASAASTSSVASSDHCRSSRTTSAGPMRGAARSGSPRTASRGRRPRPARPSSGRIRARWARSGPQSSRPPGRARSVAAQDGHERPVGRGAALRRGRA